MAHDNKLLDYYLLLPKDERERCRAQALRRLADPKTYQFGQAHVNHYAAALQALTQAERILSKNTAHPSVQPSPARHALEGAPAP